MKIIDIEGVGEKYAETLVKAKIANVEDLISLKWSEIKELAKITKISLKLLEKWQDQAELMVIKGVGPEYSEVLNKIGVDSSRELAYRNPKNILDIIIEFDKKQPDVIRKIPKIEVIEGWINEAKDKYIAKKTKKSPKETPIIEIVGIGKNYVKTMEIAGFLDVESLIGLDRDGIKKLAEKTKISEKLIDKWAEHADLMRIDGIGPEYAEVINEIGINSVKEFAQRNPNNTLDRIMKLNKEKPNMFRRPPTLTMIKDWIKEAKSIGPQLYNDNWKKFTDKDFGFRKMWDKKMKDIKIFTQLSFFLSPEYPEKVINEWKGIFGSDFNRFNHSLSIVAIASLILSIENKKLDFITWKDYMKNMFLTDELILHYLLNEGFDEKKKNKSISDLISYTFYLGLEEIKNKS